MSGTTPNYAFPYPDTGDAPDPSEIEALATAVDTSLETEASARAALASTVDAQGRGRMGGGQYTTVNALVNATEVMLITTTFTCAAGRRYRAYITGSVVFANKGDVAEFKLGYTAGATVTVASAIVQYIHEVPAPSATYTTTDTTIFEFEAPGAGQYSFGLSCVQAVQSVSGTACHIVPDAHQPVQLAIDDVGVW